MRLLGVGGSTVIDWKRRSSAASFSMYLRYSSKVVAPMHWISPRARAGLRTLEASMAPSAPPAPTSVWSSSMKRMTFLARRTSFITALMRSSNWPRYLVPATIIARSSTTSACPQELGDVLVDDPLGEAFDDGGLAHAGFAEEHRVVLGAAAEDLDDALDLLRRPITGSSSPCLASSVRSRPKASSAGVLLLPAGPTGPPCHRRGSPASGVVPRFDAGAEEIEHLLADLFELEPEVHQHLGGDAVVLTKQAEQEVLGADVVVVEVAGLLDRVLDDLLGPRRLGQLAHGDHLGAALDELLDLEADLAQVDVEVLEDVGADSGALLDEAEQDVLGPDVLVVEPLGLLVGEGHHLAGSVGESFEHGNLRFGWQKASHPHGTHDLQVGSPDPGMAATSVPEPLVLLASAPKVRRSTRYPESAP